MNNYEGPLLKQPAHPLDSLKPVHMFTYLPSFWPRGKGLVEKAKKCAGIKHGVIHPGRSWLWVRGGQGTRVKAECKECCLQPQKTQNQ